MLGDFAGAGASIPLSYWREMKIFGIEKQKQHLLDHAWSVEFERIRSLLIANAEIRPDQVFDCTKS